MSRKRRQGWVGPSAPAIFVKELVSCGPASTGHRAACPAHSHNPGGATVLAYHNPTNLPTSLPLQLSTHDFR